ncbi:WG repeat-containing protein [Ferruginibacter sp. SUN002]|uniref:WG repeat-containing protein n=1 Tax=Ferruginibacter sp. SUN002 TaxID=2937789 RepID=UPI003D35D5DE
MKLHLLFYLAVMVNSVSFSQLVSFKNEQGKYGFKTTDGIIKVQPIYDVVYTVFENGRLCVNKGFKNKFENNKEIIANTGKWGFIDGTGKEVIPLQYQKAGGFKNGLAKVMLNDKWGFINPQGKFVVQPMYTFIDNFEDNIAICNIGAATKNKYSFFSLDYEGGKWGAVDRSGKLIIPTIYDKLYYLSDHKFFSVTKNNLRGILSQTGTVILPVTYTELFIRNKDCFIVKQNNKYGVVNRSNQTIVPFEYNAIPKQDFTTNFLSLVKDDKTFKFELSGKALPTVVSPEPHESNFQKALAAAANSKQRGEAINQYVTQLHTTQLTEDEKIYLLGEKFKQVVDIDYYGMFEAFMHYKNEKNNATIYLAARNSLTKEQISYITIAAQHVTDEFIAASNNKPAPEWPKGLPKPGYGWGKTVSSDKPVYANNNAYSPSTSAPVYQPAKAAVTEAQLKSIIGRYYKERNATYFGNPKEVVIKIISYNKNPYNDNFQVTFKQAFFADIFNNCNVETKTVDAETIWYGPPLYDAYDPYLPAQPQTCKKCNGSGKITTGYSHTNDYEYTYGAKVTYSSTSTQACSACNGGGSVYSSQLKKLATCLE